MTNAPVRRANIITLFLTLLFILISGEVYLRYQYKKEHDILISKYKGRELCTASSAEPGLIYTFIPNKCGSNSHGYRDYEYRYKKDPGAFRIVVIGDSVAQGQGVELRESFCKVLETKLNQSVNNRKFEVIVLARTGYSTAQELILLKNEAFNYQPDLIIWSYMLNDPAHPVYHNANGELGRYYFKPKLHFVNFVRKKIFELKEESKSKNCGKEFHKLLHCAYWDQVKSQIYQIGGILKSKNIPVLFLVHPIFEKDRSFDTYTLTSVHKKLYDAASESGLIAVDLLNAFKPYNMDEVRTHSETWYDPWHPNAKGHMVIADYIYKHIGGYLEKIHDFNETRKVIPREIDSRLTNFYDDFIWTKGNSMVSDIRYDVKPGDNFLVLKTFGWNPLRDDLNKLGLKIVTNGSSLKFSHKDENSFFFVLDKNIKQINEIQIMSSTFVPKEQGINNDTRRLGIDVASITIQAEQ
ncbi:MAG: SGNH/GDSL hydrolase family protein [Nitrospirae bacterium]|nr:SGNH/GDSL hydrolase family protein [Nitrospirota bacterium]